MASARMRCEGRDRDVEGRHQTTRVTGNEGKKDAPLLLDGSKVGWARLDGVVQGPDLASRAAAGRLKR
jgi:hypothetical protein